MRDFKILIRKNNTKKFFVIQIFSVVDGEEYFLGDIFTLPKHSFKEAQELAIRYFYHIVRDFDPIRNLIDFDVDEYGVVYRTPINPQTKQSWTLTKPNNAK